MIKISRMRHAVRSELSQLKVIFKNTLSDTRNLHHSCLTFVLFKVTEMPIEVKLKVIDYMVKMINTHINEADLCLTGCNIIGYDFDDRKNNIQRSRQPH